MQIEIDFTTIAKASLDLTTHLNAGKAIWNVIPNTFIF